MAQKKKTKKPNIQDHMPSAEEAQKELATATSVDDFFGKEGIFSRLFADTLEQMLEAELTEELGYEPYDVKGRNSGNSRNGNYQRKMRSSGGDVEIKVPRDRNGEFHSELLKKNTNEIEDKIFTMYAKGMSTRDIQDIQDILEDLYGIHVSPTTISKITDKVWELVEIWQNRPLDQIYAIVYLDAIHVKLRREGKIDNVAVYNVLGVNLEGRKDVLGNWVGDGGEGSQFLAQRSFRSAGTRRTGYLHRCGGRPEWVQGCYSACFSENKSSALHHPSNPAEPEIHHLERQKSVHQRPENDLQSDNQGRG